MAKRSATRELNHNNWDEEEEAEERGEWKPASAEAIQGRVIKQARRKLTSNQEEKPSVFAGFAGFGARTSAPTTNAFGSVSFLPQSVPATAEKVTNGKPTKKPDDENNNEKEYLANLKVLNEAVSSWIADHVRKSPYCILTPIFTDYEKHLKDLEAKRGSSQDTTTSEKESKFELSAKSTQGEPSKPAEAPKPSFSFSTSTASTSATTPSSTTFSFKPSSSDTAPAPFSFKPSSETPSSTFSFGAPPKSSTTSSTTSTGASPAPFSFGLTKPALGTTTTTPSAPFSFGLSSAGKPLAPAAEVKKEEAEGEEGEEDEDSPPKVEITPVKEEDAYYSIKCKLFYKKDNSYAEKGVGTLHLKKVKEDKTQVIIRAENTIGTILLNIFMDPKLTTQRVGKNNVMLVCIPNPPIDPKVAPVPTPMLLRVKTDVEADELLAKLNEAKKE